MSRRIDRARASRRTSGRQSQVLAGGRGDARDHRRENQRLTDHDLDPDYFEIRNGKLTLAGEGLVRLLAENGLVGEGLELDGTDRGSLRVKLGATLQVDEQGRLIVDFDDVAALDDQTDGTASVAGALGPIPDPANTPASADALRDDLVANALPAIRNALATLSSTVNQILQGA